MHWRLVTPAAKANNKRMRDRRWNAHLRHTRRQKMFQRLGYLLPPDLLDAVVAPSEAFGLQYRTLQKARTLLPLFQLRLCRHARRGFTPAVNPVDTPHTSNVAPVLHRSRRSPIYPWLVSPVRAALPAGTSFTELMMEADKWREARIDPYDILDRLAAFCGSYEAAADLELRLGLITAPVSPEAIAEVRRAREFWDNWSDGVHHHLAAVDAGLLPPAKGDNWACFDHPGLMELLPGLRLPRAAVRDFYVIRLEGHFLRRDLRLVIHSRLGKPLALQPL